MIYTLNFNPVVADWKTKKQYQNGKLQYIRYLNIPVAFDIEDSHFYIEGEKYATMYLWAVAVNDDVYQGRTWEEFDRFIEQITENYKIDIYNRIIIYVHNLSHEFAFMSRRYEWINVFAAKERRPIYALRADGVEFRCSYYLTGLSLENLADTLNDGLKKLKGYLDYSLIRHSKTPLTKKELQYSANDVLILTRYIKKCITEENGDITKIPMTKTGYVRRLTRNYTLYNEDKNKRSMYRQLMKNLTLDLDEYAQLQRAFMGGYTHCSCLKSGKTYTDVTSFDFASSYPAVMIAEKYPMGKGKIVAPKTISEFETLCNNYCVIFDVQFENIEPKIWYEHYLSVSKCVIDGCLTSDNGRLVSCLSGEVCKTDIHRKKYTVHYDKGIVTTTLTNVDWKIVKKCYKWETVKFANVRIYQKEYLPKSFVEAIITLYEDKTKLKDVEGQEDFYLRQKTMLNSMYGANVMKIIREIIEYTEDGWRNSENVNPQEEIERYNKSRSRFNYFPWGVFITAYSRFNIWTGVTHFKNDYIYSDTDSLKVINANLHMNYINGYNQEILKKLEKACEYHGIDVERIRPKTKEGVEKPLGIYELDGEYKRFKSLGAKRYLTEYKKDNSIHITVAGIAKKAGETYLKKLVCSAKELERYNKIKDDDKKEEYINKVVANRHNEIFEKFDVDLYFPKGEAGKMLQTYIDYEIAGQVTDYKGITAEFNEMSAVHLEQADFSMDINVEYFKFLLGVKDNDDI